MDQIKKIDFVNFNNELKSFKEIFYNESNLIYTIETIIQNGYADIEDYILEKVKEKDNYKIEYLIDLLKYYHDSNVRNVIFADNVSRNFDPKEDFIIGNECKVNKLKNFDIFEVYNMHPDIFVKYYKSCILTKDEKKKKLIPYSKYDNALLATLPNNMKIMLKYDYDLYIPELLKFPIWNRMKVEEKYLLEPYNIRFGKEDLNFVLIPKNLDKIPTQEERFEIEIPNKYGIHGSQWFFLSNLYLNYFTGSDNKLYVYIEDENKVGYYSSIEDFINLLQTKLQ